MNMKDRIRRALREEFDPNLKVDFLRKKNSGFPSFIMDTLKNQYPNNWGKIDNEYCQTPEGIIDIFPVKEGERWSILNFFDTNPGVIEILLEEYDYQGESPKTYERFKEWITENSEDIFGKNSQLLKRLIERNLRSFKSGWDLEDAVVDLIKKKDGLSDDEILRSCIGSLRDRVDGIDLEIDGKTYQIKPGNRTQKIPDPKKPGEYYYLIDTYGMKNYKLKTKLDYIIYSNGSHFIVFPNHKYWVSDDGKQVKFYNIQPKINTVL